MKETLDLNLSILEALQGAASIIGYNGEILHANEKWKESGDQHFFGITDVSVNYFEHLEEAIKDGNDYALKLIFGLREVLDDSRPKFEMSIPSKAEGQWQWNRAVVSSFGNESKLALIIFDDISKNIKLLKARRESQELYLQHFNNSLQGIIMASPNGKIYDVNPAACKILGYTKSELIEGGRDLIVSKDDPLHNEAFKIREKTSKYEGEKIYIHKDGHPITVEISSVLYRNSDGDIRSINTFRDKTKEKRIERYLEEERNFNEAAVNSIPGIFFVINKKGELIRWNNTFSASLRFKKTELLNRKVFDFIHEPYRKITRLAMHDAFKNGSGNVVTEVLTKTGDVQTHQIYANKFIKDGEEYLVGTGYDITHLIEAESEKEKSIEMMSQLFNNSPLAMILIDPDNKIKQANKGFYKLFKYSENEVVGKKPKDLITTSEKYQELEDINCMAFSGSVKNIETTRVTKHGEQLNVLINTVPVEKNGEIIAVYGIYVDMTDQKMLEQKLQNSLREKEVLFAEIHHRVKNNLAVIAGMLDLQVDDEESEEVKQKLNEVRSRIFSIAKINESLYGKNNVVSIRFDEYMQSVSESLPQKDINKYEYTNVELNTVPVSLNLNQAVSGGLIFNELMNTILDGQHEVKQLKINLSKQDNFIEISIEGDEINIDRLDHRNDTESFQKQLVTILLSQVKADLKITNGKSKKVAVRFKKSDISGPSSSIKSLDELNYPQPGSIS